MANDPAPDQFEKGKNAPADQEQPGADTSPQPAATPRPGGPLGTPLVLQPGGRPIPDYELVERLGAGGYGEVWKAHGPGGFPVALKFIRLGDQAGAVELRSLEVMRGIRHPHLLGLFGAWKKQDLLIVAMELGDRTLYQRLQEARSQGLPGIPREELLEYMREAAKGIDYLNDYRHPEGPAEQAGIQHKDIKPQNLLLVGGGVKVADFGLAKLLQDTVATASASLSPAYAAPEFFKGQVTRWSDQYSLAVSYCHLRGGRLPFTGDQYQVMMGHLMNPPDLTMLPTEEEQPAVVRALAKEPGDRWSTCRAFVEGLGQRVVRGPVPVPPPAQKVEPIPASPTPGPLLEDKGVGEATHPLLPAQGASGGPDAATLPVQLESPPPSTWRPSSPRRRRAILAGGILLVMLALPAALVWLVVVAKNGKDGGIRVAQPDSIGPVGKDQEPLTERPTEPPNKVPGPSPATIVSEPIREPVPKEFTNNIGMKLVLIPAGKFLMGSPNDEEGRDDDEGPQHEVEITRPFYLGRYEVTRGQFRRFVEEMDYRTDAEKNGEGGWGFNEETGNFEGRKRQYTWKNAGFAQTDQHPVANVSWNDAKAFCDWLSKKEGKKYRLPTEAEWEYSCRAGTMTRFYSGDDAETLAEVGNVADGTAKKKFSGWTTIQAEDGYVFTAPVGRFLANRFGLHDMHGNVWEWCEDWYDKDHYRNSPVHNPQGPSAGSFRVSRGGSFSNAPRDYCRAASRDRYEPAFRHLNLGFRIVCER
jgi:formylglycine-generating enzyme required for sulfatase activity